jgi:hypothetical protein
MRALRARREEAAVSPARVVQSHPDGLQFGDIEEILRPAGALLHLDEIVDRRHEERLMIDRHPDSALPQVLEVIALADQ